MASTSPEPKDNWDQSNVEISLDKMQTTQMLSTSTSSGPLVKESSTGSVPRKLLTSQRLVVLDKRIYSLV